MPRKPSNLLYDVNERPPLGVILVLAVQHLFFLSVGLIFPVMIIRAIGGTTEQIQTVVSLSMIAAGVASIIQSLPRGPVGSGFLCGQGNDPTIVAFSILAGKAGGLPLIFGMTIVSGLAECFMSRFLHRLRSIFPAEVTGVILAMVSLTLLPLTITAFFGAKGNGGAIHAGSTIVAIITLAVMCGVNIWGKGKLRLYSVICGISAGFTAAWLIGLLPRQDIERLASTPLLAFPDLSVVSWSFSAALLVPVLVATFSSLLKSVATLTMCQKINDADWKRPDMDNISKGILADGLATVIGGALGGMGQSLYAASAGLSLATGATSRIIAWFMGGVMILLGFFPKVAAIFSIMPVPVMGASLFFILCFMFISGAQIMMSRMIDIRKTFIIGVSLMFGISVDIFPDLYRGVHPLLQPFFNSSLALTTMLAITLNLLFRIGITNRATITLDPACDSSLVIANFLEDRGGLWGARREVIQKAIGALTELYEAVTGHGMATGKLLVVASFDELRLDLQVTYPGVPLEMPAAPPSQQELLEDERHFARLAGFLIRRLTDSIESDRTGEECRIRFHFDH